MPKNSNEKQRNYNKQHYAKKKAEKIAGLTSYIDKVNECTKAFTVLQSHCNNPQVKVDLSKCLAAIIKGL